MSNDEQTAVRRAAERFYVALNALLTGDPGPMTEVWSHADDVTYMGPAGGFQTGWDQVLAEWQAQAAMKLGGEVRTETMVITLGEDLAATHSVEVGENTNVSGASQPVRIRATNLFRKESGIWKMIGHHTDPLPFLAK